MAGYAYDLMVGGMIGLVVCTIMMLTLLVVVLLDSRFWYQRSTATLDELFD